ncbi:MAG: hypothetical protein U9Q74_07850 [Gemmatimonadota bacterium]|nr:hypothetical protein [Gemmatimonadota bacterium]
MGEPRPIDLLVPIVVGAIFVIGFMIALRRFEARRRRGGKWDASGPIDPTPPPPDPLLHSLGVREPVIETEEQPPGPDGVTKG